MPHREVIMKINKDILILYNLHFECPVKFVLLCCNLLDKKKDNKNQ